MHHWTIDVFYGGGWGAASKGPRDQTKFERRRRGSKGPSKTWAPKARIQGTEQNLSAEGANPRDLERSRDHSSELARSLASARSALEFCLVPWAYLWLDFARSLGHVGSLGSQNLRQGTEYESKGPCKIWAPKVQVQGAWAKFDYIIS